MGEQSAARLEGDRYQHLFSWYVLLELLNPEKEVVSVWVEHPQAGAADDVTIHYEKDAQRAAQYYQIKWHVDHSSGYSMQGLIDRGRNATSLLEKLWKSWLQLREQGVVEIWLVSNWAPQANDPLGTLIGGRDYALSRTLLEAPPRSTLGGWRKKWQEHLRADDETFARFYGALRFRLGFVSIQDLEELVDQRMRTYGLQSGEQPRAVAIDQVRRWVELGGMNKMVTAEELRKTLDRLQLWASFARETALIVRVHTWAVRAYGGEAAYELEWSSHFDHRTRRVPATTVWQQELLPQLQAMEKEISQSTPARRICLQGSHSLSVAFVLGHTFSTAGGYCLDVPHREQIWKSETSLDPLCQLNCVEEPGSSDATDLLVVVSITGDARPQVQRFVQEQGMMFHASLFLTPHDGLNEDSVKGAAYVAALARHIRRELRRALGLYTPAMTHLFYFGPQSLATLIGQKMNACGAIQLYEFQNPGYVASCVLR